MDSGAEVYGTLVSDIQTDVEVTGKVIIPKTIESPYVSRDVPVKYCNYVDLKKIVGASVVWNQLVKNGNFTSDSGWTTYNCDMSVENGVCTYVATGSTGRVSVTRNISRALVPLNHTYMTLFEAKADIDGDIKVLFDSNMAKTAIFYGTITTEWSKYCAVGVVTETSGNISFGYTGSTRPVENTKSYMKNLIIVDLTAMFGTTIADYVYTLEQSEAGTGLAWLQSYGFFTEDYYEYTENKIESVCTNGRTSKGITYPISAVELRGLFDVDNGVLTVDGDEYKADGSVKRRFKIINLGNLNWSYNSQYSFFYSSPLPNLGYQNGTTSYISGICDKYIYSGINTSNSRMGNANDKTMYGRFDSQSTLSDKIFKTVYVKDSSYTDADIFKTAMNGVYLIYELATPEVDLTIPFNERQKVGSTEQFDDYGVITGTRDVSIPVGNETDYLQNFGGQITGTLHYIEDGLAPSGYLSGSGNFIALHLDSDDWTRYTSVKVGLDPSQASGMVEILQDEEKIVVGKITSNEQVFIVESTDGTLTKTDVYDLSELVLETE